MPSTSGNGRPATVLISIALLVITCLINIASVANTLVSYPRAATPEFLTRSIGFDILWILFVIGLWQRQNWARFAIVVLIVLGAGSLLFNIIRFSARSNVGIFVFAIPMVIAAVHIGAAVLIFLPDSEAWFKK